MWHRDIFLEGYYFESEKNYFGLRHTEVVYMLDINNLNTQNTLLSKELELMKQNTYKHLLIFQNLRNSNHAISSHTAIEWHHVWDSVPYSCVLWWQRKKSLLWRCLWINYDYCYGLTVIIWPVIAWDPLFACGFAFKNKYICVWLGMKCTDLRQINGKGKKISAIQQMYVKVYFCP